MITPNDYTSTVRNLAFKHPLMSSLIIQVLFWGTAHLVLGAIIFFNSNAVNATYNINAPHSFTPIIISSATTGLFFGFILGCTDFYFFRKWSKGKSLGALILIKGLLYFIVTIIIFALLRYVLWKIILQPFYFAEDIQQISDEVWRNYFILISIYTFFMSVFISFIIQINKRFGPGILLPLILGKYVHPKIEKRAFIFLDLKSSTMYAEKLGHVKYSEMLRDSFLDINHVCAPFQAEIYQYVGDEIVLCWPIQRHTDLTRCIDFYFACQARFISRKDYYQKKYDLFPEFKAGIHRGIVTGVEVGDIKRELAFHGDTLNVAARIQAKCNEFEADVIISDAVHENLRRNEIYTYELIGTIDLKGRTKPVVIYKVSLV